MDLSCFALFILIKSISFVRPIKLNPIFACTEENCESQTDGISVMGFLSLLPVCCKTKPLLKEDINRIRGYVIKSKIGWLVARFLYKLIKAFLINADLLGFLRDSCFVFKTANSLLSFVKTCPPPRVSKILIDEEL